MCHPIPAMPPASWSRGQRNSAVFSGSGWTGKGRFSSTSPRGCSGAGSDREPIPRLSASGWRRSRENLRALPIWMKSKDEKRSSLTVPGINGILYIGERGNPGRQREGACRDFYVRRGRKVAGL